MIGRTPSFSRPRLSYLSEQVGKETQAVEEVGKRLGRLKREEERIWRDVSSFNHSVPDKKGKREIL